MNNNEYNQLKELSDNEKAMKWVSRKRLSKMLKTFIMFSKN